MTETSAAQGGTEMDRFVVEIRSIDPAVPERCVRCLGETPEHRRKLTFRRSDGTVERVSVVHWPYCNDCYSGLQTSQRRHRVMSFMGLLQVLVVMYLVGGAVGYYDILWPSVPLLAVLFVLFIVAARRARDSWADEWARIDDVYKGGRGAKFTFRNSDYADLFASANADQESPNDEGEKETA